MKKNLIIAISILIALQVGMWSATLHAADMEAILDDAAGGSAFSVKDSGSVEQAHIDSDGNMVIKGGLRLDASGVEHTTAEDLIVDGNIGIGTTGPLEKLDVEGRIRLAQGFAPATTMDKIYNIGGNLFWNGAQLNSAGGTLPTGIDGQTLRFNGLSWLANSTLYNDATNIGIGTTSPAEKLEVAGNIKLSGASATYRITNVATPGATSDVATKGYVDGLTSGGGWTDGGTNVFLSTLTDRVGIGITGPSYKLDVAGTGTDGQINAQAGLCINGDCKTTWTDAGMPSGSEGQMIYNNAGAWTAFSGLHWDDTTSRLGIGTTAPSVKLHVVGDGSYSGAFMSGNVGIGTTSPSQELHVAGDIKLDGFIYDVNNESGSDNQILSKTATGVDWIPVPSGADNLGNHTATQNIRLSGFYLSNDGGDEGMYVDTAGNVGIGTTSPSAKLTVEGGKLYLAGTGSSSGVAFDNASIFLNAAGFVQLGHGTEPDMVINGSGLVGIGTTSPGALLTVGNNTFQVNSSGNLIKVNNVGYSWPSAQGGAVTVLANDGSGGLSWASTATAGGWTDDSTNVYLATTSDSVGIGTTAPSVKLHVVGDGTYSGAFMSGNVGIGTTSPFQELHVAGDIKLDGFIYDVNNESGSDNQILSKTATGVDWIPVPSGADNLGNHIATENIRLSGFYLSNDGGDEGVYVDTSGNVGIGTTSPSAKLTIEGGKLYLAGMGSSSGIAFDNASIFQNAAGFVQLGHGTEPDMVINGSGLVGIGTTSPGALLTVGNNTFQVNSSGNLIKVNNVGYSWPSSQGGAATVLANDGSGGLSWASTATAGGWTDGGTNVYLTTSTDNVGIGTTGPRANLDVGGTTQGGVLRNVFARMGEGDTTGDGTYLGVRTWATQQPSYGGKGFSLEHSFYGSVNSAINFYRGGGVTGGFIRFATNNGTEQVTIDSSGNVGIGTTSPGYRLDVQAPTTGMLRVAPSNDPTNYAAYLYSGYTNANIAGLKSPLGNLIRQSWVPGAVSVGINDAVTILNSNGNVGIGTTAPQAALDVASGGLNIRGTNYATSGSVVEVQKINASLGTISMISDGATRAFGEMRMYGSPVSLWPGGAAALTALSSGNVGIGTTSPARLFHIHDVNNNQMIQMTGAATGPTATDGITMGVLGTLDFQFWNYENGYFRFGTNNQEAMRITSTGNVGIGTTGPGDKLHVSGGNVLLDNGYAIKGKDVGGTARTLLYFSNDGSGNDWLLLNANGTNPFMTFQVGTEKMRILSSGNVGIGTTGPARLLSLYKNDGTSFSGNPLLVLEQAGTADTALQFLLTGVRAWSVGVDNSDSDKFKIAPTSVDDWSSAAMTIDTSGNVGIGTTAPGTLLSVGSNTFQVNSSGNLVKVNNVTYSWPGANASGVLTNNGSGTLSWGALASAGGWTDGGTNVYLTTSTDNVGIGTTSPGGRLHVVGNIVAVANGNTDILFSTSRNSNANLAMFNMNPAGTLSSSNVAWYMGLDANSNNMSFATYDGGAGALTKVAISNTGNVGIGTTGPSTKLDVAGNLFVGTGSTFSNAAGWNTVIDSYGGSHDRITSRTSSIGLDITTHNTGWAGAPIGAHILTSTNHPLSFGTNSGVKMTILSGGNVGIGTTGPLGRLDVQGATARTGTAPTTPSFYVTGTLNNGQTGPAAGNIEFRHDNQTQGIGFGFNTIYQTGSNANQDLNLLSRGTSPITLNAYPYSTGYVGIGTTSPSYKLDVRGTGVAGQINAQAGLCINADCKTAWSGVGLPTGTSGQTLRSDGSNWVANSILYNDNTNVGIGTTNPGARLNVRGSTSDSTAHGLRVDNSGGTGLMVVRNDGNVGIGTASPNVKLSLSNNVASGALDTYAEYQLMLYDTAVASTSYGLGIRGGTMVFNSDSAYQFDEDGTTRVTITGGNVGIGTTGPGQKLTVALDTGAAESNKFRLSGAASGDFLNAWVNAAGSGELRFIGWDSGWNINQMTASKNLYINRDAPSTSNLLLGRSGLEVFIRGSDGNVGIGTTGPSGRLDISSGNLSLILGGDNLVLTRTDSTTKVSRVGAVHYTNSEEPMVMLATNSNTSDNILQVGGGTSLMNTATQIRFYTASNNTTVSGTEQMRIDSSGSVGIGTTNPGALLTVGNNLFQVDSSGNLVKVNNVTYSWPGANASGVLTNNGSGTLSWTPSTGTIGGSGATNYVPKFTASTTLGNSLIYDNGTNVGIGTTGPTALLHLAAGTTTLAPLKLISGTNLSSPEEGALEFDGTSLYFTPSASRKTIAFTDSNITGTASNVTGIVAVANGGTGTTTGSITGTGALTFTAGGADQNITLTPSGSGYTLLNGSVGVGTTGPGDKLEVAGGNVSISTVGKTLKVKEGTDACMGIATLTTGTATVDTVTVTANSRIFLTIQSPDGTLGSVYVSARTAGTSFTIASTSALDTSTVAWLIVDPA